MKYYWVAALVIPLLVLSACAKPLAETPTPSPTETPPPSPTEIPPPAPTTAPPIRDIDIYSEDKVAIEKAEADIELNRKGDVLLAVTDSQGRTAPGLSVEYQLVKHSFLFGVFETWPRPGFIDPEKVFELLADAGIDYSTIHLNWRAVEPEEGLYTFQELEQQLQLMYSKGFRLRGHALLFHKDTMTPEYLRKLSFDEYKAAVYRHVFDTVSHFKERINLWDAINSPTVPGVMRLSEAQTIEIIQVAIQAIRDAQYDAKIFINVRPDPTTDLEYTFLSELNKAGIAYDIVGLQIYYNGYGEDSAFYRLTLAQIGELLDYYATLGKEIHITEFSVPSAHLEGREGYWGEDWDEDLQAAYLKAAYAIFFSKPEVQSITWWDAYDTLGTFVYHGGLCSQNLEPRKAYYALKDLIKGWTTSGMGFTDEKGQISFRGFGGTYEVLVTDPETGLSKRQEITIEEQKDNPIAIVID